MRTILFSVLLCIVSCVSAFAWCSDPPVKLCHMLFANKLVIYGEVVKTEILKDQEDPEGISGWAYHINVLKTYRGTPGKTVVIRSENASARLLLKSGRKYIVFASRNSDGGYYAGSYCGEIQNVDGQPYSAQLEAQVYDLLNNSKLSFIEGKIAGWNSRLALTSSLTVTGPGLFKKIAFDEKGFFYLKVQPGTYKLVPSTNLQVSIPSPDGIDWKNPSSRDVPPISLAPGQCAQYMFEEIRK
jgi:hypothetical protein